ncbi:MAG: HAD-IC family P-type ATPase, partial [Verrucomicrobiota bacterium]
ESFASVLIVACPCALALSAPFTHGAALRLLSRAGFYLKNGAVVERLMGAGTLVFDKTGTLAGAGRLAVTFEGVALSLSQTGLLQLVACRSAHPYCARLARWLDATDSSEEVQAFHEHPGRGVAARVGEAEVLLGSAAWLSERGISVPGGHPSTPRSEVHAAVNGEYLGVFLFAPVYRDGLRRLIAALAPRFGLAVLSGDRPSHRTDLAGLFGAEAELVFEQSPLDKLKYIEARQNRGESVVMLGDGLNDAGALKQADVGIAVVEDLAAFSPASDAILNAGRLDRLDAFLGFSRTCVRIIHISFALSLAYNTIGLFFAATARLSPIICAILMPLSSITIVTFAVTATRFAGRRARL